MTRRAKKWVKQRKEKGNMFFFLGIGIFFFTQSHARNDRSSLINSDGPVRQPLRVVFIQMTKTKR